jgi:hypothetical protein
MSVPKIQACIAQAINNQISGAYCDHTSSSAAFLMFAFACKLALLRLARSLQTRYQLVHKLGQSKKKRKETKNSLLLILFLP